MPKIIKMKSIRKTRILNIIYQVSELETKYKKRAFEYLDKFLSYEGADGLSQTFK